MLLYPGGLLLYVDYVPFMMHSFCFNISISCVIIIFYLDLVKSCRLSELCFTLELGLYAVIRF